MKLRNLLFGVGVALGSFFLPKVANAQDTGWLARANVNDKDGIILYQPQIKWQNLDRRAQTQFYLGGKTNSFGTESTQFSINPLIRKPNLDGAVAFFGELNEDSGNKYALEAGFDVSDLFSFYLGRAKFPNSTMTSGKIGKRFGKQKIAFGVSHADNELSDDYRFYAFLRTTLGDALEFNPRLDFKDGGLEKATIISQLNATGDGLLPGARYTGIFTPEQNKHSLRMSFGKNRKFSYGGVDGATGYYFTPLSMGNPAGLNYGNGTLAHGYGEYVINGVFVDLPANDNDKFALEFYKNFYNVFGIDNLHVMVGFDKTGDETGLSIGGGIQKGTFFGSLRARLTSDGKPEYSIRLDKAIDIPKEKMLLEL